MTNLIKEFWDNQALEHGASDLATAPDHFYRELEIREIIKHLKPGKKILEVGCGNGYSTVKFWEAVDSEFVGIDYSQKMIAEANDLKEAEHIHFGMGNVLTLTADTYPNDFDIIISERCLINLTSWKEQQIALLEMKKCLKPGGKIILVENFADGLKRLHSLREQFDLHEIKERWHNRYLQMHEFTPFVHEHFRVPECENIGNLYYIISRVVYAAMAKADDKEPEYGHLINKIASILPTLGYASEYYSPNFLFVLEPK